jgi:RNA polymerase sigma-70 factor (ECF subfamily)
MDPANEREMVESAKAGDTVAFERLLEPLMEPGHKLACGLLHDSYLAEDAVQEAAVNAWRKIGNLRGGAPFRPWFLGIVANRCREVRRGAWWRLSTGSDIYSDMPGPDDEALRRIEVRRALQRLGNRARLIVVLRLYLDLSWAEVVSVAGGTEAGARTTLYRAIAKMRVGGDYSGVIV